MGKLTTLIFKSIGITPLPILHLISNFLSFFLRNIVRYRTDIVRKNLKNSFPNKSSKELKIIEKLSYRNFTDVLIENLLLFTISKKNLKKRMRLLNPDVFNSLEKKNKGALLVSAHYNNWEWMALSLALYAKQEVYSVYKHLNNKSFDSVMLKARSRFGAKIEPMVSFPKTILRNKGKATINLVLADQSPHKSKLDFYCNFLNQNTPVFLGPEKLMKAANLKLLFVEVHRVKRGYYEMKIVSLADKVLNEKGAATLLHVKHLEQIIKNNPENWLWSHRRWKHSRKK